VEGDADMVKRARQNAEVAGLHHLTFYTSNLFLLKEQEPFYTEVDVLFLDPPRAGAEMVCRHIEHWRPRTILYVACDPSTFARDLSILVHEKGYRLKKVGVMDMFPHTAHVESMALLVLDHVANRNL
jgi:23S rRNA (uracil1939-C5)-methyltransferase